MPPPLPAELPDPFQFADGARVCTAEDWSRRRREIADLVVELEYGGMPPAPSATHLEELHTTTMRALAGARFMSCRVESGPERPFAFLLTLLIPPGDGPFPVVLTGDACWRYVTEAIAADVVGRGMILAQFNRVELAPDIYRSERTSGLYRVYPEGEFGALAAWAWGYHRCVDALGELAVADSARIAVVGHSRGGKTALLAGATDPRIALTAVNNSGAGGAGCYRWQGPESETLADLLRGIPYWFGPHLGDYLGREAELPFDQHFLKALVAPRALLTTEALGDLWANPTGTWHTHCAAREVYRFLGAEERLGIWYREGGHQHGAADWRIFLDFMEWQLGDQPRPAGLNTPPQPDLPPAYAWTAPAGS
jgi:hypothetical protein